MPLPRDLLYDCPPAAVSAVLSPIFAYFGLTYSKAKPMATGGCSAIWQIKGKDGDKLTEAVLRVEIADGTPSSNAGKLAREKVISGKLKGLAPKVYHSKVLAVMPDRVAIIHILEKLDIVEWTDWHHHFDKPSHVVRAIFTVLDTMLKRNVIHTDVSVGNLVLTRSGHIRVIDLLDACIEASSRECLDIAAFTAEYQDPRLFSNRHRVPEMVDTARTIHRLLFGREPERYPVVPEHKPWNKVRHRQAMIYAGGSLALAVVLGVLPYGMKLSMLPEIDLLREKDPDTIAMIAAAVNPSPEKRRLLLPKKVAKAKGRSSSRSTSIPIDGRYAFPCQNGTCAKKYNR